MFSAAFARDLAERVVSTFAQALVAVLVAGGTGIVDTDWPAALSVAGMAAVVSLLKGVAAYAVDNETGASALTSPPPRVERGAVSVVEVLLIVLVAVVVLALLGVL